MAPFRHSTIFATLMMLSLLLAAVLTFHAKWARERSVAGIGAMGKMVREMKLTDLCLFTEARYTRHPAMADLHAAFQEHPAAMDHFPSGSLLLPPPPLKRPHANNH